MCCKIISPELLALLYAVCIPDILLSLYFTQLWAELAGSSGHSTDCLLWPPYGIEQAIIILPCGFFLSSSGYIFGTKACIDNPKKNLLNSNTSSTCPDNMVNFSLLAAKIGWRVWGTPATFNGFRILAALLHGTWAVGMSQTLRHCTRNGIKELL